MTYDNFCTWRTFGRRGSSGPDADYRQGGLSVADSTLLKATNPLALELALSGGGVRAMAFHAGVLKLLAEQRLLECVSHISSVSGGSLLVGLIFQKAGMRFKKAGMRWPTSADYLSQLLPAVREQLITGNLQAAAVSRLLLPWNWRHFLSRANVLAQAIEASVGRSGPHCPNYRSRLCGPSTAPPQRPADASDSSRALAVTTSLGYANASKFPLSQALAMSAAFPGAIGPLAIKCNQYEWRKRPYWNALESEEQTIQPPFATLHLYDGGLYDNLGLEPLFDMGTQRAKTDGTTLIVSDAGAPLLPGFNTGSLNPLRMKRWFDLANEQQRSLRIRSFVNALRNGIRGAYLQ